MLKGYSVLESVAGGGVVDRSGRSPIALRHNRLRAAMRSAAALLILGMLSGCAGGPPPPYEPPRPGDYPWALLARDPTREVVSWLHDPQRLEEIPPPLALDRIDALTRRLHPSQIEPDAVNRAALEREQRELDRRLSELHIGMRELIIARWNGRNGSDDPVLRRLGGLLGAKAVLALHYGTVEGRLAARELIERALVWDPGNPVLAILLARVLKMGAYHRLSMEILERYGQGRYARGLLDLERLRAWEGQFQATRDPERLERAHDFVVELLERHGRRPWILLEKARLELEGEHDERAEALCREALNRLGTSPSSNQVALRGTAHLNLAYIEGRALETARADSLYKLARAQLVAAQSRGRLTDLMKYPWDLLSRDERMDYDQSPDQRRWLEDFWNAEDPILATPGIEENQIEYWNRIMAAEAHFGRLRLELTGPETEPGRAVLRFGWPKRVAFQAGQTRSGTRTVLGLDFGIYRNLLMNYVFHYPHAPKRAVERTAVFEDGGGDDLFAPAHPLRGSSWPPRIFDFSFGGRYFPMDADCSRFQQADGSTSVIAAVETLWPNPRVLYPLSDWTFHGALFGSMAHYRRSQRREELWIASPRADLEIDRRVPVRHRGPEL
ncbi:MAG: GWxTD domain-containing protein, partial [Candidatus Eisenbacteria bacterium]|nr:GWxTD domain-containing protein [Candidatus Eisenbacteria bacterium]